MSGRSRGHVAVAALTVPILFGAVACGDKGEEKAKAAASSPCPSDLTASASTPVPGDVPVPDGANAYSYNSQGKTRIWFLALDGRGSDLTSLRDAFDNALKGKGYEIEGTDQEPGAEADSEFKGPHEGTSNFQPVCSGKVRLRLKLTS